MATRVCSAPDVVQLDVLQKKDQGVLQVGLDNKALQVSKVFQVKRGCQDPKGIEEMVVYKVQEDPKEIE